MMLKQTIVATIAAVGGLELSSASESQWSFVTASGEVGSSETFKVPEPISEGIIVLVSESAGLRSAGVSDHPVVGINMNTTESSRYDLVAQPAEIPGIAPWEIIWPDKNDRIAAAKQESIDSLSTNRSRNPWTKKSDKKNVGADKVFSCGGVVIGGEKGPIALLNGRVVRIGDKLTDFKVTGIVQEGVVLGLSTSAYMVPEGKRAIVTIPGN